MNHRKVTFFFPPFLFYKEFQLLNSISPISWRKLRQLVIVTAEMAFSFSSIQQ